MEGISVCLGGTLFSGFFYSVRLFFFFIFHTSWIISVLEQNSPNLFLTPIWYHREWSDPDHIHNLHADHCPSRRLSASVRDFGRLVFLNAYPCRPPRGSLSPEPPMNHGITIADSGTRIQHVGFWGWGGGREMTEGMAGVDHVHNHLFITRASCQITKALL